jgi:hypothetical protein
VTDPALEPRPTVKPSLLTKRIPTSLSAVAASRRVTLPATPVARQKRVRSIMKALRWAGFGLLLSVGPVAVVAARDEMSPRLSRHVLHGAAEIKRSPNGDQVRWRRGRTTIFIDSSVDRYGPRAREAVQSAFGTWLELGTHAPNLAFDSTRDAKLSLEPDGRNTVLVAPITLAGHEDDLAITLAFWDERTGSIAEADIVVNSKAGFEVIDENRDERDRHDRDDHDDDVQQHRECVSGAYDLQNVLTHEVGHFMGLGEDMKEDAASMYFRSHRCETQKRTLERSDEISVVSLYVDPPSEDARETRAAAGCSLNNAPADSGSGALLAVFVGLALLGSRRRA